MLPPILLFQRDTTALMPVRMLCPKHADGAGFPTRERSMRDVLIIGGSYFAGRVLVEELLKEKDYRVFVYNRGRLPLRFDHVTELIGDREDGAQIQRAIPPNRWSAVVDFCAYTPDHIEKMIRFLPGSVEQYIFISTTTVYAYSAALPLKEDAPKLSCPQPELGSCADYGLNKWLAECKLAQECIEKGIAYTSLRPAIIYGKYNYAPRESYFFDLMRDNKPVVLPDNELALFSFVWVVDVAKAVLRCAGNPKAHGRAFNLSGEELISYRRLIQVLEEVSGKSFPTTTLCVDEINRRGIPLPFPLDSHLLYSGREIQRVLGFEYTPFEEGMKKTYEHYQAVQEFKRNQRLRKGK